MINLVRDNYHDNERALICMTIAEREDIYSRKEGGLGSSRVYEKK